MVTGSRLCFLLASLSSDLQLTVGCFAAGMKISTSKFEVKVLSWKTVECRNELLVQVEQFKYLEVLVMSEVMSEGRVEQKTDKTD